MEDCPGEGLSSIAKTEKKGIKRASMKKYADFPTKAQPLPWREAGGRGAGSHLLLKTPKKKEAWILTGFKLLET